MVSPITPPMGNVMGNIKSMQIQSSLRSYIPLLQCLVLTISLLSSHRSHFAFLFLLCRPIFRWTFRLVIRNELGFWPFYSIVHLELLFLFFVQLACFVLSCFLTSRTSWLEQEKKGNACFWALALPGPVQFGLIWAMSSPYGPLISYGPIQAHWAHTGP